MGGQRHWYTRNNSTSVQEGRAQCFKRSPVYNSGTNGLHTAVAPSSPWGPRGSLSACWVTCNSEAVKVNGQNNSELELEDLRIGVRGALVGNFRKECSAPAAGVQQLKGKENCGIA
ncbi:hypothetical protein EDB83DRAFT_2554929 [Lactarius deliciosus]|nr:hypothetical protein EDB83DRAFT_2554929 [Lactarius deliciosus]